MSKKTIDEKDLEYVLSRYRARIKEFGLTFDSLQSGSSDKQRVRHAVHCSSFRTEAPSILDIGCGMGGFLSYLRLNKITSSYKGYDIAPEYIEFCQTNYPEDEFEVRNVFETGIDKTYDNIILSQVLNNKYSYSDNMTVMKEMMTLCFNHCTVGFSIDMMSEYVDFKTDELYYYSPEKIFSFAKTLSKRVAIRHDFRPFEFCVQVFKMDAPGFVS
jgi:2-polyprenyl-3-methyl-5-hydroxy-6-metoxy-1,4-benzoquinol methylase